jgi:aminoglycoside 3-N-acetyltransferase I
MNENEPTSPPTLRTVRLHSADVDLAKALFGLMARVFDENSEALSDGYVQRLLSRDDFWAVAAFWGDELVGGVTAHTLPLTRTEAFEVFIYDIAVLADYQRRGVGRELVMHLQNEAATLTRSTSIERSAGRRLP